MEEELPVAIPDSFEPITAWRCWNIYTRAGRFRSAAALMSVTRQVIWPVGEGLEAKCGTTFMDFVDGYGCKDGPGKDCSCGVYTKKDLNGILKYCRGQRGVFYHGESDPILAYGPALIWGKVQVHEDGYRSEYAYPKGIIVQEKEHWTDDHREWLRSELNEYGVPVTFIEQIPPPSHIDDSEYGPGSIRVVTSVNPFPPASNHAAGWISSQKMYEQQQKRIEELHRRWEEMKKYRKA